MLPSTCRRSKAAVRPRNFATGWSMVLKISSALVSSSGRGTSGASTCTSAPPWVSWKEEIMVRIGMPSCKAVVRRCEKDLPSRSLSTAKLTGLSGLPPRMK